MLKNSKQTRTISLGACDDCIHACSKCFNAIAYREDGQPLVKCDNALSGEVDECGRIPARTDISSPSVCERSDAYQKQKAKAQRKAMYRRKVA